LRSALHASAGERAWPLRERVAILACRISSSYGACPGAPLPRHLMASQASPISSKSLACRVVCGAFQLLPDAWRVSQSRLYRSVAHEPAASAHDWLLRGCNQVMPENLLQQYKVNQHFEKSSLCRSRLPWWPSVLDCNLRRLRGSFLQHTCHSASASMRICGSQQPCSVQVSVYRLTSLCEAIPRVCHTPNSDAVSDLHCACRLHGGRTAVCRTVSRGSCGSGSSNLACVHLAASAASRLPPCQMTQRKQVRVARVWCVHR